MAKTVIFLADGFEEIEALTYNSGSVVAYNLAAALLKDNKNNDLKDELLTIEAIADKINMNLNEVLSSLTLLEMKGLIISASGKRYKIR